jgi:enoyl-CoA hydratase/carnithine racemase
MELSGLLPKLDDDPELRVVVIMGEGKSVLPSSRVIKFI